MTLEDKLIENLVNTYKMKGIDMQELLHNSLFLSLPLSEKIRMIEKYSKEFNTAPKFKYTNIVNGGLMGAGTALTAVAGGLLTTGKPLSSGNYKLALGAGALLGIGARLIEERSVYNSNAEIAKASNPYLRMARSSIQGPRININVGRSDPATLNRIPTILGTTALDADKPQ